MKKLEYRDKDNEDFVLTLRIRKILVANECKRWQLLSLQNGM